MYREIKKKHLILENRKPFPPEIESYMRETSFHNWIDSSMRLDGSLVCRQDVLRIMKGEFVVSVNVIEHSQIQNYREAIREIYLSVDMKNELDEKLLEQLYCILFPKEEEIYRSNNPVLFELRYNPPHFKEIREQMELLFDWLNENKTENPIRTASYLHHKIVEIYPFGFRSKAMARMALLYILVQNGFPPIALSVSETEYNETLQCYLKNEEIEPFYQVVERGVYNQLEIMLQLTAPCR